jgi:hypothetical protein
VEIEGRSRRDFLKFAGGTLGAGLGLLALPPAVVAQGIRAVSKTPLRPESPQNVTFTCYANAQTCGCCSGTANANYNCIASGCASFCTGCQAFSTHGSCYSHVQGGC